MHSSSSVSANRVTASRSSPSLSMPTRPCAGFRPTSSSTLSMSADMLRVDEEVGRKPAHGLVGIDRDGDEREAVTLFALTDELECIGDSEAGRDLPDLLVHQPEQQLTTDPAS